MYNNNNNNNNNNNSQSASKVVRDNACSSKTFYPVGGF